MLGTSSSVVFGPMNSDAKRQSCKNDLLIWMTLSECSSCTESIPAGEPVARTRQRVPVTIRKPSAETIFMTRPTNVSSTGPGAAAAAPEELESSAAAALCSAEETVRGRRDWPPEEAVPETRAVERPSPSTCISEFSSLSAFRFFLLRLRRFRRFEPKTGGASGVFHQFVCNFRISDIIFG